MGTVGAHAIVLYDQQRWFERMPNDNTSETQVAEHGHGMTDIVSRIDGSGSSERFLKDMALGSGDDGCWCVGSCYRI